MNLNRGTDGAGHRAVIGVHRVDALNGFAHGPCGPQFVMDRNPPDHENIPVKLNLADRLRRQLAL